MRKEYEMSKKFLVLVAAVVLLLVLSTPVFANTEVQNNSGGVITNMEKDDKDNNGNGNGNGNNNNSGGGVDDAPPDPGVSSGQDNTKTETIKWVLPHGDTFMIDGEEVNIVLDWENITVTDTRQPGNGSTIFIGIGGNIEYGDDSYELECGNGNGRGNCNDNGNGGNGGGPIHGDSCGGVWVTPGVINASARQIAPNFAVITGQDPDENGVTLEYNISISPTVISYEKWTIVGQRKVACVEDDNGNQNRNGNGHDEEWENGGEQNRYGCGHNNCDCPNGWHPVVEHIWACTAKEKVYKEGIDDLVIGASLQLESRQWIEGELASAYPGAKLLHPDWGFTTTPNCTWNGDVCSFQTTLKIPVTDPGWYDIKL
jgi:hypothetical protein